MSRMTLNVDGDAPRTLGDFLRKEHGISAMTVRRLKNVPDGVTRRGDLVRTVDDVFPGDVICLHLPEESPHEKNIEMQIPVLYESESLIVVNKPVNVPCHPSMLHRNDTLANWFAAHYPEDGFHLVGRLDRNTSGAVLIAKNTIAAHALPDSVSKRYFALIPPGLTGSGMIDAPLGRTAESVITRCVRPDGHKAVTEYEVIGGNAQCTLVALRLHTGRTHQIRVHMAYIGYPLLGDSLYGGDCSLLSEHALHCGEIAFRSPADGQTVTVKAPLRADMQAILGEEYV